ncbi:carbohydrate ABC transporter permease [Cohnella lupini]|uniref:Carbohydrate ABC transporter membrane protein 2 (CUT1 family) n=1 Tax=Cohnella lupini TaxID=1294267 RepID=A0A3D9ILA1_9BACL|nr:carbohydrate ABC transporter permease [Cohnella lupini]RED61876.1 carbohydrate ABC transporter membrane protein 2 (CUT1 family) [Cohnella lupini]
MNRNKATKRLVQNITIWIISLIAITPILLIVINAFKTAPEASSMNFSLPHLFQFENFSTVIEKGKLVRSFVNSVSYSGLSSLLCILVSATAAFALARNKIKFNRFLYFFIIMGIALPLNYFTLIDVMKWTQLMNTKTGIIVLYSVTQIPFSIFILYGFIGGVPRELDEAGIIDGCGPKRLFFSVIFPVLRPAAVTVFILSFLNTWNEFLLPLYYLNSADKWPMTLAVYNFFGQFQQSWNLVSADIILTILPVVIVYLLGQRFIISGMTSGSVKG